MLDVSQLNAIGQDKAYGRGIRDCLDFVGVKSGPWTKRSVRLSENRS
jgi:hypothetical protein